MNLTNNYHADNGRYCIVLYCIVLYFLLLTIDQKERRINEVTPKVWTKNFWGHFIIDTSLTCCLVVLLTCSLISSMSPIVVQEL